MKSDIIIGRGVYGLLLLALVGIMGCSTAKSYFSEDAAMSHSIIFSESVDKEGEKLAKLKSSLLPALTIYGEIAEKGEEEIFYVTRLRFFSNWENGWTEAFYEASGEFSIVRNDESVILERKDVIEIWDITGGKIRYFEDYYYDEDDIGKVRGRIDRIREVAVWLHDEKGYPPYFEEVKGKASYRKKTKTFLFPEMEGFKKVQKEGKLPEAYNAFTDEIDPLLQEGAGIVWQRDYTAAVFPDNFAELRNSGTLWRDYEEAPMICLTFYNWDYVMETSFPLIRLK